MSRHEQNDITEGVKQNGDALAFTAELASATSRRKFLTWAGVTVGVSLAAACSDGDPAAPIADGSARDGMGASGGATGTGSTADPVRLGSGDILVLNFAYALEQLEAEFYELVVKGSYWAGANADEKRVLDDIRKHEIVHREFLKEALGSAGIPKLEFDFSTVNFGSRESVLTTARTLEDVGVSAYNGAGKYLQDLRYLLVAGKIVSVEARHASVIRDILAPKTSAFAGDDVINAQGLDVVRAPRAVFTLAAPFIKTEIDASNLPTS